jgi:hypothetical protein
LDTQGLLFEQFAPGNSIKHSLKERLKDGRNTLKSADFYRNFAYQHSSRFKLERYDAKKAQDR